MSIKRRYDNEWIKSTSVKRYTGSEWQNVSGAKRYDGGKWVPLWRESGYFSKTYAPVEYASYYVPGGERLTGIPETNGMPRMIHGSPDWSPSTVISTMIFFPLDEIAEDLHDAEIADIYLDITKYSPPYDNGQTFVLLHYGGGYTGCPERWDGSDSGDADNRTPFLGENQSMSAELNRIVGEAFRDGRATFISLNAIGLCDPVYYTEYDASSVRLRINYRV